MVSHRPFKTPRDPATEHGPLFREKPLVLQGVNGYHPVDCRVRTRCPDDFVPEVIDLMDNKTISSGTTAFTVYMAANEARLFLLKD